MQAVRVACPSLETDDEVFSQLNTGCRPSSTSEVLLRKFATSGDPRGIATLPGRTQDASTHVPLLPDDWPQRSSTVTTLVMKGVRLDGPTRADCSQRVWPAHGSPA